ncbi:MAG TPA: hypothetical protein VGD71_44605 [Kribbella sp.]|jgi:hypothetical protein
MGHRRKPTEGETFAKIISNPGEPPLSGSELFSSPIREGEYLDPDGVRWRKRGGLPKVTRVEHLIRDRQIRVLHIYLSDVREVWAEDRDDFLSKIRPYLKGSRTFPHRTTRTSLPPSSRTISSGRCSSSKKAVEVAADKLSSSASSIRA